MIFRKKKPVERPDLTEEERTELNIKRKKRLIKQLRHDAVIKVLGFIIALFVTFTCIFGVTLAPTNDMFPAVHEGDMIVYYRLGKLINTDVVIYNTPSGQSQIGRVEATSGETIGKTEGGLLTINGNIQPVQKRSGLFDETFAGKAELEGEVPEGKYLVLGDARETAEDSRAFGLIDRKDVKGKVFTIVRRRPL